MNSLLAKFLFFLRKPKIIIITGSNRSSVSGAIHKMLGQKLKVRKISDFEFSSINRDEILIFEAQLTNLKTFKFLIKNSQLPILIVTNTGETSQFTEDLLSFNTLILNSENRAAKEAKDRPDLKVLTFGLQDSADFFASDIKINPVRNSTSAIGLQDTSESKISNGVNHGINFKLNYQGNTVPIWLDYLSDQEQIYNVLATIVVGTVFDLNLVEISQSLKSYRWIPEIDKIEIS